MTDLTILLASESIIKRDAVMNYFTEKINCKVKIIAVNCDGCKLPPQPIGCGMYCARERLAYAKKNTTETYDIAIAIESDLSKKDESYFDCANVRIEMGILVGTGSSNEIGCPPLYEEFDSQEKIIYSEKIWGFPKTGGEFMNKLYAFDPKNWMMDYVGFNRERQILVGVTAAFTNLCKQVAMCRIFNDKYVVYKDFPKEGVNFEYFYTLFVSQNDTLATSGTRYLANILQTNFEHEEIDLVFSMESRGLYLGALLADRLNIDMIPIQKKGKVPGPVLSTEYTKEYGPDVMQVSKNLVLNFLSNKKKPVYKFLIVDDLIATGGTLRAVLDMLESLSKEYSFRYEAIVFALKEVGPLANMAREKIGMDYIVLFRNVNESEHKLVSIINKSLIQN